MDDNRTRSRDCGTEVWRQATRLYDQYLQFAEDSHDGFESNLRQQPEAVRKAFESLQQCDLQARQESFLSALSLDRSIGPNPDVRVGTQLGPYRLEELIAEGGTGIVYRARRCSDYDQMVAIKLLSPQFLHGRGRVRFQAEKHALARLIHPHICRLLDAGDSADGTPYLVMEYIEGGPIDRYCRTHATSLRDRVQWFADACRAVAFAHSQGLLHRDIKPANVLIDNQQQVHVTDFGLAKSLESEADRKGVTVTGEILGTPGYMAPEQAFGQLNDVSVATDVYGLGALLYALLVERPPFRGDSLASTLMMVKQQEPLSPRALRRDVPRDLETICLKCLEKRQEDRYSTVDSLLNDVERYLDDRPIAARPIGPVERLVRWARRYPSLASLAGALVVVTLTSLVVLSALLTVARATKPKRCCSGAEHERWSMPCLQTSRSGWRTNRIPAKFCAKLLLAAKEHYEQFAREQSDDPAVSTETATAWFRLGKIHGVLGDSAGREQAAGEASRRFQQLARQFPERHQYRFDVFHCYYLLHEFESAYRTIHQLVLQRVEDPRGEYRSALVTMAAQLSGSYLWRDAERAAALIAESEKVSESLQAEFPDHAGYASQTHVVEAAKLRLHLVRQEYAEAAEAARKAVQHFEQGQPTDSLIYGDDAKLKGCYELLAAAAWHLGDDSMAKAAAEQSVQVTRQAAEFYSASVQSTLHLARAINFRSMIYHALGEAEQASQSSLEEKEVLEKALQKWPDQQQFAARLACLLADCPDPAVRDLQRAGELVGTIDSKKLMQSLPLHVVQLRLGDSQPLLKYLDSRTSDNRLLRAYRALALAMQGKLVEAGIEHKRVSAAPHTFNLAMDLPAEPILAELESILPGT